MQEKEDHEEKDEEIKDKKDLAEDRTDWAQERTLLAKERTFSAWARTGISAVAAGLGIARLLQSVNAQWIAKTLGILFIAAGAIVFVVGFSTYYKTFQKMDKQDVNGASIWFIGIISFALLGAAILAIVLLFQ
jgi:putative membrane protein